MGSALLRPTGNDLAVSLLQEIEKEVRRCEAANEPVDYRALLAMCDARLNRAECDDMRIYILAYLGKCLTGTLPRLKLWQPLL
jgi:hypothetical protein